MSELPIANVANGLQHEIRLRGKDSIRTFHHLVYRKDDNLREFLFTVLSTLFILIQVHCKGK